MDPPPIEGGTELPDSDGGAAAPHPYTEFMDSETAALFDRMPADPSLDFEIKLLRTFVTKLNKDLEVNQRPLIQIIPILIRAVLARLKQGDAVTDLERLLRETADETLAEMENANE